MLWLEAGDARCVPAGCALAPDLQKGATEVEQQSWAVLLAPTIMHMDVNCYCKDCYCKR